MEAVQRLVRSLKSARSYDLPEDPKAAYYVLLSSVMQNQHRTFIDLLTSSTTFDVNFVTGKSKRTLLHMAANVGSYECLCYLLKKDAEPNLADRQGITPLQVAARNGFVRCITKLLENGADVEIKNNEGMTAIHWLAANGRTEAFSEVTMYLRNIDIDDVNLQTPLHVACLNGHKSTVLKLLDLNADINKKNIHGCTPLYFACRHGHVEVVQALIARGASFASNNEKESPLDVALKGGYAKVCHVLIGSDRKFLSMLLQTCQNIDIEISKVTTVLLFLAGCEISLRNTILYMLSQSVHTNGLKLLSPSSDYEETSKMFIRSIKIFNALLKHDPRNENRASQFDVRLRSESNHRSSSFYDKFEQEPDNIDSITTELNSLWNIMNSWMTILEKEMKCDSSSDSSSLHSVVSHLKRNKQNVSYNRQISKESASFNLLRLSQPAVESLNRRSSGTDATNEWENGVMIRSGSYHHAMDATNDEFERTLSPTFNPNENSDTVATTSGETPATEPSERKEIKSIVISNDETMSRDSHVVELTADRLCAVIHGYFLYCQAHPIWEKSFEKNKTLFNKFIQKHEEVLHLLVARKSELIFEHFCFILENHILFQRFLPAIHAQPLVERQKWFYENLYADEKRSSMVFDEGSVITVTRESLLSTSCKEVTGKSQDQLKKNVTVRFAGEDGMGAGVTREWLDLLVKEMLNPDCALFTLSADGSTFQPNSNSSINPDHLSFFQFAGKIMGLALYHKHLITAYFTRSFYKHILGIPVSYVDVECIDPEYSKNLQWIIDNDITDLGLDITFSVETDVFGQMQEVELKENGKHIVVTDENKFEYVHLAADLRMTKAIKPQIISFLRGFYDFVPHSLVSLFNEYELELLLSGLPDIGLNDWMKNTSYQAGFTQDSQTIQWFWEVVSDFCQEEQIQLLQFVTGTSRVPWGGFSNLSGPTGNQLFTICRVSGNTEMLPTSSTCFNMLKLPDYENKEELKKKLKIAVTAGSLGFEFT